VAGIYAATDQSTGMCKAPANAPVQGAMDLEVHVDPVTQGSLNKIGVNCIRAFPGRGILLWGARTLSLDPAWEFVNVCRTMITIVRWLAQRMIDVTFEPNNLTLWVRIQREVSTFLQSLFQAGALAGTSPSQAFFVKCDAETNTPDVQAEGAVVTIVGVAPALPSEFVVVQIVSNPNGVVVSGPPTSAPSVTMTS
jgi:phage tail sheath protein FI